MLNPGFHKLEQRLSASKTYHLLAIKSYIDDHRIDNLAEETACVLLYHRFQVTYLLPGELSKTYSIPSSLESKSLFFWVQRGILSIHVSAPKSQILPYIHLLSTLNNSGLLKPSIPLTLISAKFRASYADKKKQPFHILGMASRYNYQEIAFIPYYVLEPYWVCRRLKGFSLYNTIPWLRALSKTTRINSSKLYFCGSLNNEIRRQYLTNLDCSLQHYASDHEDFLDSLEYQSSIDIYGLDGHSGRRFWMMHMGRCCFLPADDPHKLFYEMHTPPQPFIHYIPYNVSSIAEIPDLLRSLNNNNFQLNELCRNMMLYSSSHLSFHSVLNRAAAIINKLPLTYAP